MNTRQSHRTIMVCVLLAAACSRGEAGEPKPGSKSAAAKAADAKSDRKVAPEAEQMLRAMSTRLAELDHFGVHAKGALEVVLHDGQKLQFPFTSDIKVVRPNRLRSDRTGEKTDLQFFYDGKTFTLFGKNLDMYATAPAPAKLDDAITVARDVLDLEAPAADLIMSDPFPVLMSDVVEGMVVGAVQIDGTPCHHLAFRGKEVDWQIWIDDERNLPMRYVISSKTMPSAPEFVVELRSWDTTTKYPDTEFVFAPPPEAKRVEFIARDQGAATRKDKQKEKSP